MINRIDQYVLSKFELGAQFLLKNFNIKLCSIIDFSLMLYITAFGFYLYFVGGLGIPKLILGIIFGYCMVEICFNSKKYQREAEDRAEKGLSNPNKICLLNKLMRITFDFLWIVMFAIFALEGFTISSILMFSANLGLWIYLHITSIDIPPPSKDKNKNKTWLNSLFRRKVLSS